MSVVEGEPVTTTEDSSRQHADPVTWARHFWRQQELGPGEEAFIAMSSVLRFHRLMTAAVEEQLKKQGLNLTDYMLLMTLELSPAGTRPVSRLARGLLVHATTATLAADRLAGRGLLTRAGDPTDRRATLVSITEEGRDLVQAASAALSNFDYGLSGTSTGDRAELVEVLARLRAAAGD